MGISDLQKDQHHQLQISGVGLELLDNSQILPRPPFPAPTQELELTLSGHAEVCYQQETVLVWQCLYHTLP